MPTVNSMQADLNLAIRMCITVPFSGYPIPVIMFVNILSLSYIAECVVSVNTMHYNL